MRFPSPHPTSAIPHSIALFAMVLLGCGENARSDSGTAAGVDAGTAPDASVIDPPPGADGGAGASCSGLAGVAGARSLSFVSSDGRTRTFELFAPGGYDPTRPTPLVLQFHGGGGTGVGMNRLTGFNAVGEARGMLVVAPDGVGANPAWNGGNECSDASDLGVDDVAFVRELIEQVGQAYCVDRRRIYATGHSSGARFAHRLGCEASDLFAAIAPNAGQIGNLDLSTDPSTPVFACAPPRPVPIYEIHGTADCRNPYAGGVAPSGCALEDQSVPDTIAAWAMRNGCATSTTVVFEQGDARCMAFDCPANAETVLCTIEGGGHAWPGSGREPAPCRSGSGGVTSSDLNATTAIADFFMRHVR